VPPAPTELRSATAWSDWIGEAFAARPERARHSRAVWQRLVELGDRGLPWLADDRRAVLELAGLLHDIGRALDPRDTEPHGFVGARYLEQVGLPDLAPIVAHHSGSLVEAELRGMSHLDRWQDPDRELVALLTYVDATVDHEGRTVTIDERHRGLVRRYGNGSYQVRRFELLRQELGVGAALANGSDLREMTAVASG
jgi:hypothetical protein